MDPQAANSLIQADEGAARGWETTADLAEEEREVDQELRSSPSKSRLKRAKSSHEHDSDNSDDELDHLAPETPNDQDEYEKAFDRRRASVEKKSRKSKLITNALIIAFFICCWYLFSTLISLYNKWMFSADHYGFPYPLFVTSCHMLVQFTLCSIVLSVFPKFRPNIRPAPREYGTKAVPCGIATGLDIGLSNLSLKFITLSFYTMCKSSVLAFVLLFAFIFKLERPSWRLVGVIGIITVGVSLMVSSQTQFHLVGMVLVLSASALSGLRWSLTQMLLDKEAMGMNNPFATLFFLAPIMGITLAICSIFIEGWITIITDERFFGSLGLALKTMLTILLPGFIAFCMNVSEFFLIQRTSVVTLSVAGIFKETATIFLSTVVFHDILTPINISGLCVALFGIALYNYLKWRDYSAKILADREGVPRPHEYRSDTHFDIDISDSDAESISDDIELARPSERSSEQLQRKTQEMEEALSRDPDLQKLAAAESRLKADLDEPTSDKSMSEESWQQIPTWDAGPSKADNRII